MAEFKQWREENRKMLKDVVPLETPFNILIEASSLCNAKCKYCAHASSPPNVYQGNMSMEIFQKVLRDAHAFPEKIKLFEMFCFGEPLCNPHLATMIHMAKQEGVVEKIAFTTNGLLFRPENIHAIIASGVDIIRISLQGLCAETYWKMCGVHVNFERFLENLRYLYQNKKQCSIRMKIADIALKEEENGEEHFREIFGEMADSIFVEHIIPMFSDIDYHTLDPEIANRAIHGRENVKQTEIHTVCHRPFYRLRVAADGKVTASCCDTPYDLQYGNIHDTHLYDLWNGKLHMSFLRMQLEGKRFQHPLCKNCVLPNDITNEADILDPYAPDILKRWPI